jgi:polysaccharide export outer membrane protein
LLVRAATPSERSATSAAGKEAARSAVARASARNPDYVLQPLDVLRVHVLAEEDLNKQMEMVNVSGQNTINLPLIGTVNLQGKTQRQAEELIRAAYDKDFLVNPQVTVAVVKYAERSVNVFGQVQKPDRVPFPPERGLTIVEAIAAAGGTTRLADLKKVKLTRNGETEEINVDAMMNKTGREAVQLQKDDVIFVPERIL